ncbi:MAG: DUF4249 domain-containing protein [Lewinellaceae bacterium]|nr:DUF4249 domain-containing protein [Lewinellaceae bacterium]
MFRRLSLLTLATTLLVLPACEDPAPFSLSQKVSQLVVVGNFTRDLAVQVVVSKSQSILDEAPVEYVRDATVEIYQGDTYLETLELIDPKQAMEFPYYATTQLVPEANVLYTIRVSAPGYEPVTARSKIPDPTQILSAMASAFQLEDEPETNQWIASYQLSLSFEDPGEELNFYHISLFQQIFTFEIAEGDTLLTGQYMQPVMFDPKENSNIRVAHISGGLLLSDEAFDSKIINFDIPLRISLDKDRELLGKLFVDLRTVSEEYYRYFSALSRQGNSNGSPFSEPVILFDNIDGGQGIFAGYNSSLDSLNIRY